MSFLALFEGTWNQFLIMGSYVPGYSKVILFFYVTQFHGVNLKSLEHKLGMLMCKHVLQVAYVTDFYYSTSTKLHNYNK